MSDAKPGSPSNPYDPEPVKRCARTAWESVNSPTAPLGVRHGQATSILAEAAALIAQDSGIEKHNFVFQCLAAWATIEIIEKHNLPFREGDKEVPDDLQ